MRRFLNNNLEKKQLKDWWSHDPTSLGIQLCFKYYSNHTTVLGFFFTCRSLKRIDYEKRNQKRNHMILCLISFAMVSRKLLFSLPFGIFACIVKNKHEIRKYYSQGQEDVKIAFLAVNKKKNYKLHVLFVLKLWINLLQGC